jgi:uncharacterized membrane protein YcjF (UPF0283 family)
MEDKLDKLISMLEKDNILETCNVLGNKKEIFKKNLVAGLSRGIGIGIGVTIMTAIILMLLQKIISWNVPIIGDFIVDLVKFVERNKT